MKKKPKRVATVLSKPAPKKKRSPGRPKKPPSAKTVLTKREY